MRKKRTGVIEDIFDMLVQLPWWVGVAVAIVFWIIGLVAAGTTAKVDGATQKAVQPISFFALIFNVMAFLSLVAAGISAIRGQSRKKLLDGQNSIESLRALSWRQFEQLVGEAYRRQGYDVEETGGGGADGGIDLVLRGHGETVLVQCKQWREWQVGVNKVRELFGVMTAERANRGILVAVGKFTNDALSFKVGKPITLVDGEALMQLVRNVQPSTPVPPLPPMGVATSDQCPVCGSDMVRRMAKRGANAGKSFFGCTRYPACKGIRPVE